MNILNICDTEAWDLVAYQALHTAARFVKTGHNATVICHKGSRLHEECQKLKINTRTITLGLKFGFFETGGWDLIHFYNPDNINQLLLKKARASARIFITQLKLGSRRAFEKLSLLEPYVDRYIAACSSVQEEFFRVGIDQRKTFMVPPAINLGRWESAMLIKPAMFVREPRRGISVAKITQREAEDIYRIRASLEGLAISLTIQNKTPDFLVRLKKVHEKMIRAAAKGNFAAYQEFNEKFHDLIITTCGNQRLIQLIRNFDRQTMRYRLAVVSRPGWMDNSTKIHAELITAFETGNTESAERIRKQALLERFGSVDRLKKAPVEKISAVPGISAALAATILENLSAKPA